MVEVLEHSPKNPCKQGNSHHHHSHASHFLLQMVSSDSDSLIGYFAL